MSAPFAHKKALVVGLGRSGRAAAALLGDPEHGLGYALTLYDQKDQPCPAELEAARPRLVVGSRELPEQLLKEAELVLLSPGVDPRPIRRALARVAPATPVRGELGLSLSTLLADCDRKSQRRPGVHLVTGTNGKSSVTALTHALFEAASRRSFAGANLGTPVGELALALRRGQQPLPEQLVLECSSYQLETLHAGGWIATDSAALLNLSPDHLSRYDSFRDYGEAKARIFEGLGPSSLALLDALDPASGRYLQQLGGSPARLALVGRELHWDQEAYAWGDQKLAPRSASQLVGAHNRRNIAFALGIAAHAGLEAAELEAGLRSFKGLPHRMNAVLEREGILYVDDSKATNVAAVLAGLRGFERPFVLLAGGQLKGEELRPLIDVVHRRGRGLIAFGQGRAALQIAWSKSPPAPEGCRFESCADLEQAIEEARKLASAGEAIVLSPAGASWDAYPNFAARGRHFAELAAK